MCRRIYRIFPVLLLMAGCHAASSPQPDTQPSNTESRSERLAAVRDLDRDESAGGHTLRKHVGRTDSELRDRLQRERHIAAASTYTDRTAAERAITAAISQEQARIDNWIARAGGHPNLVLDYDAEQPVGRTLHRGKERVEPCARSVVVLKWVAPADYYVLTSYPECR